MFSFHSKNNENITPKLKKIKEKQAQFSELLIASAMISGLMETSRILFGEWWLVIFLLVTNHTNGEYNIRRCLHMIFWLLAVQSTVTVNGKDVAFDYTNTYYEESDAIKEAKLLSENDDVLSVSVHKWILNEDGSQEHADGDDSIPYSFLNKDHREWK